MTPIYSSIKSFGHCVPDKVVTNKDLEKMMETSDEWIQQRSGVKERRWVQKGDTLLGLSTNAAKEALERGETSADEVDAIIFSTLISDYVFPGTGVLLQKELKIEKYIPALDIRNMCSGFLYALSVADAWIRSGFYKNVLIVCGEIHSTSLDKTSKGRDISVLFGDGAAACLLKAETEGESRLIDHIIASQGEYAEKLYLHRPTPNDFDRVHNNAQEDPLHYPYMDGRYVFKNAVVRMAESLTEILKRNQLNSKDIDFVLAHQANKRIISTVLNQLEIPEEKTHYTLDRFGNTTSATIPLTFYEAINNGQIKRGDLVALTAFGAGFTWGSTLLRY